MERKNYPIYRRRGVPRTEADLIHEEKIGWWEGIFKHVAEMQKLGHPAFTERHRPNPIEPSED